MQNDIQPVRGTGNTLSVYMCTHRSLTFDITNHNHISVKLNLKNEIYWHRWAFSFSQRSFNLKSLCHPIRTFTVILEIKYTVTVFVWRLKDNKI